MKDCHEALSWVWEKKLTYVGFSQIEQNQRAEELAKPDAERDRTDAFCS